MRRICSDCGITLGEKCAGCGSENVLLVLGKGTGVIWTARWIECRNCGNLWIEGADMPTHGICNMCRGYERTVPGL